MIFVSIAGKVNLILVNSIVTVKFSNSELLFVVSE